VLLEIPARPSSAAAAPAAPGAPPVTGPPPPVDDARWARKLRGQEAFAEYMREVRAVAVAPGERTRQLIYQVGPALTGAAPSAGGGGGWARGCRVRWVSELSSMTMPWGLRGVP
jgi:hypothetical protein